MRKRVSAKCLYEACKSGGYQVMEERERLNLLNVFPVADQDTGSNLFFTFKGLLGMEYKDEWTVKDTFKQIARRMLIDSKGNSGTLFAQFMFGLTEHLPKIMEVDLQTFANAALAAAYMTYEAVEDPVEGTLLTVSREWGKILQHEAQKEEEFEIALSKAEKHLKVAVKSTENQLEILKKAHKIDSGAWGFYLFTHGFSKFILDDLEKFEQQTLDSMKNNKEIELKEREEEEREYKEKKPIEAKFMNENPEFSYRDRMDKPRIALVTDSVADIPKSAIHKYRIQIIDLEVMIGKTSYYDRQTINSKILFRKMEASGLKATSSQPSIARLRQKMILLEKHYDEIIIISVSKALSGTYGQWSKVISEIEKPNKRIELVDSRMNAGAQGLLVLMTAKAIYAGKTMDTILKNIERWKRKTHILVRLDSLKTMAESGRLNPGMGRIMEKVGIHPLVTLDTSGKGVLGALMIDRKSDFSSLVKHIRRIHKKKKILMYCISYVGSLKQAKRLANELEEKIEKKPSYIVETSTLVALNAGERALAISYLTRY